MIAYAEMLAVAAAVLCGIALGSERQSRRHAAGLRTLTLISLGSCLLTQAGIWLAITVGDQPGIQSDPGRLASYVIAGIGFLGAGPIVARGGAIKGLTTAADIWIAASIGILCGIGRPEVAGGATLLVLLVLLGLEPLGDRLAGGVRGPYRLVLRTRNPLAFRRLDHLLDEAGLQLDRSEVATDGGWLVTVAYRGTGERCIAFLTEIAELGADIEVLSEGDSAPRTIGASATSSPNLRT